MSMLAQGPSGMERAQALAEQVRAEAIAREAQAVSEQARQRALEELRAAQDMGAGGAVAPVEGGFQVGPGGEIIPGGGIGPGDVDVILQPDLPAPPPPPEFNFPDEIMIIVVVFCLMIVLVSIGTPIARAYARRLDRRHAPPEGADAQAEQLRQIQNAVETMAIEVERISENQRFVTRLLSEGAAGDLPLAAGRPEALPVDAGRAARDSR